MLKRKIIMGTLLFLLIMLCRNTQGTHYYVDPNGDDDANGLSWETAFATIQRGIDAAYEGDIIDVNVGTYYENVDFNGVGCTVKGTDPDNWDIIKATIINGSDNGSVVTFDSNEYSNSILMGFTITDGCANDGGGVYCDGTSPVVRNCYIYDNTATYYGGGIYCTDYSNPSIEGCVIEDNSMITGSGAGIAGSNDSSIDVNSCIIVGNNAYSHGGGVYIVQGSIRNSVLYDNSAGSSGYGGAIYAIDVNVVNCSIVKNNADYGGGIYGGISGAPPTKISNCIIWDNNAVTDGNEIYGDPTVRYSDVMGDWSGTGNINIYPEFGTIYFPVGADGIYFTEDDGLRLRYYSPCIDAADGNEADATDILSNGRYDVYDVANKGVGDPCYVDIGAYESQWTGLEPFGMEVVSASKDDVNNVVTVVTTGATYVLGSNGMGMYRRIDPHINDYNETEDPYGRLVATLDFYSSIGTISLNFNDSNYVTVDSNIGSFKFFADSMFFIEVNESFTYDHSSIIDAEWNAPLNSEDRDLDRLWTDGYGGSLHGRIDCEDCQCTPSENKTTITMSDGNVMAHMVFPPKFFDFNGLYGSGAKPHVHYLKAYERDYFLKQNDPNWPGYDSNSYDPFYDFSNYDADGFGTFHLWGGLTFGYQDSMILGTDFIDPNREKAFIQLAHDNGFKVIAYHVAPSRDQFIYGGKDSPDPPPDFPAELLGTKQDVSVTMDWLRHLQEKYDLDGWYFDSGNAGDLIDDYYFMREMRTDVGKDGKIINHDSVDVWGGFMWPIYPGLRAIMLDAYVNYTLTGETGCIAHVNEPNNPYFRYYTSGYGMSQAYGSHLKSSDGESAMPRSEIWRTLGENLFCTQWRYAKDNLFFAEKEYNIDLNEYWEDYYWPAYKELRDQYQNDPNNFIYDVNWPVDGSTGWFREPTNIVVADVTNTSVIVFWTTQNIASNSELTYTCNANNWQWWADHEGDGGPAGVVSDSSMVTEHGITLTGLEPGTEYQFKIRSSNNAEPKVPDEIIWGYVGEFTTATFEGVFYVRGDFGRNAAVIDIEGDLLLRGALDANTQPSATAADEFRIQDSNGTDVAIIDTSDGNMYIAGSLYEEQEDLEEGDYFIIRDSNNTTLAYIDESGNLYLLGQLNEEYDGL